MLNLARRMTLPSMLSYAAWRVSPQFPSIDVRLRDGVWIELRRDEMGNNDSGIAREVFVLGWYDTRGYLRPEETRFVVDLGANVGYSVVHWLGLFPNCRVLAFEPNPRLLPQVRRNLSLNHFEDRVELYEAAAGASTRRMSLTDAGSSSSLTEDKSPTTHSVEVVDVLHMLAGRKIDLLKIDIEGGEYEILADPRFDDLDIGVIVLEWHGRTDAVADKRWCEERLAGLGFSIDPIFSEPNTGMFWAVRSNGRS